MLFDCDCDGVGLVLVRLCCVGVGGRGRAAGGADEAQQQGSALRLNATIFRTDQQEGGNRRVGIL
jgi:hypothetical protein